MSSGHAEPLRGFPLPRVMAADPPIRQAYHLLHFVFVIAPLLAGIDKFLHLLVNWDQYLAPWIARLSPIGAHGLMNLVGIIEIIAALVVALWPKVGAWIVTAWLWAIIINLLSIPGYYDIALRDFGLSLAAIALARLAVELERPPVPAA